jgi:hypothetical protein
MREVAAGYGIDLAGSYAYSDSVTDLPMLEAVGNPVAVNPDRELRRVAAAKGWEVRTFERPVALRGRVTLPSRGRAVAAGGVVVALAAGAAAGWWWLRRREAAPR